MAKGYTATLKNGKDIFIPNWPVDVALENLTTVGKYLGTDRVLAIAELNIAAVILGIMEATEAEELSKVISHFVCQARYDGDKITKESIATLFEEDLKTVAEIFAHVMHSQYADFFSYGLVKENSPGA